MCQCLSNDTVLDVLLYQHIVNLETFLKLIIHCWCVGLSLSISRYIIACSHWRFHRNWYWIVDDSITFWYWLSTVDVLVLVSISTNGHVGQFKRDFLIDTVLRLHSLTIFGSYTVSASVLPSISGHFWTVTEVQCLFVKKMQRPVKHKSEVQFLFVKKM